MSGNVNNNPKLELNFGKKIGEIKKNDGGVQKAAFGDDNTSQSIFTKYDADKNGILDQTEMSKLYNDLLSTAGNDKEMSKNEAKKFLQNNGIKYEGTARDAIAKFLNAIGGDKDNIQSATQNDKGVSVTYKDGTTETYTTLVSTDGQTKRSYLSERKFTDAQGLHEIQFLVDGKTKTSEKVVKDGTTTTTNFEKDGTTPKNVVVTDAAGNTVTTNYQNGKMTSKTVVNGDSTTEYDAQNRPIKKIEGNQVTTSEYDETSGKLKSETIIRGSEKSVLDYDNNGNKIKNSSYENGILKMVEEYNETEVTKRTIYLSPTRQHIMKDDKYTLQENGISVTLEYDEAGHLISYPKEGENFAATAKRLGVPDDKMEEFKQLNSAACNRSHGGWFKLGEKVILPEGMEEFLKLDGYEVNKQAEAAKYKQKTASTTTAATKANTTAATTSTTNTAATTNTSKPNSSQTSALDVKEQIQLAQEALKEAKNMNMMPAQKAQAIYTGKEDNYNYAGINLSGEQRRIEVYADDDAYSVGISAGNTKIIYVFDFDGKCTGIYYSNDNTAEWSDNIINNIDKESRYVAAGALNMAKEIFGKNFPVAPKIEQAAKKIYGQE